MHLIYFGTDGEAAKAAAAESRAAKVSAQIRHAIYFEDAEPADRVTLLACVSDFDADRIIAAYPDAEISSAKAGKKTAKKADPKSTVIQAVEINKSAPPAHVDPIEAARRNVIEIPPNWEGLPFMSKRSIARNIVNNSEPSVAAEVDTIIAAEVARREARG